MLRSRDQTREKAACRTLVRELATDATPAEVTACCADLAYLVGGLRLATGYNQSDLLHKIGLLLASGDRVSAERLLERAIVDVATQRSAVWSRLETAAAVVVLLPAVVASFGGPFQSEISVILAALVVAWVAAGAIARGIGWARWRWRRRGSSLAASGWDHADAVAKLAEAEDPTPAFARYMELRLLAVAHRDEPRLQGALGAAAGRMSQHMKLDAEQRAVIDSDLDALKA